jgi:hypothetical protein
MRPTDQQCGKREGVDRNKEELNFERKATIYEWQRASKLSIVVVVRVK